MDIKTALGGEAKLNRKKKVSLGEKVEKQQSCSASGYAKPQNRDTYKRRGFGVQKKKPFRKKRQGAIGEPPNDSNKTAGQRGEVRRLTPKPFT